jgi:hypothetical protein
MSELMPSLSSSTYHGLGLEHQRITFMEEEEVKCILEDRIGMLHIREPLQDEDAPAPLNVQKSHLADAADMFMDVQGRLSKN